MDIVGCTKKFRVLIGIMNSPFFSITAELFVVVLLLGWGVDQGCPSAREAVEASTVAVTPTWSGFFSPVFSCISVAHFKL